MMRLFRLAMALAGALVCASIQEAGARQVELTQYLSGQVATRLLPGADRIGQPEGAPPAAPLFKQNRQIGYAFLTSDVVASAGYSGKPVKILVALNLNGRITGALIAEHHEPILVLGIADADLDRFLAQYVGLDINQPVRMERVGRAGDQSVDLISGASITSFVFNDSILRASRLVAKSRGMLSTIAGGTIDLDSYAEADWSDLIGTGALSALTISNAGAAQALDMAVPGDRRPADSFVSLYAGVATPAGIGQNLLGFQAYSELRRSLQPGQQILFVAGHGFYSFRGYSYRQSGVFDRIQLVQGDRTIALRADMHRRLSGLTIANAPALREISLFVLPADSGFVATSRWRLELLVNQTDTDGREHSAILPLIGKLPASYVIGADSSAEILDNRPLWVKRWLASRIQVAILSASLILVITVLLFQDWVARRGTFTRWLRLGFLIFTLVFVGWITAAQLSVINVLTFVNAVLGEFHWEFFLLEPLIFVLWSAVAVALLFWGRGVFCGWLCPFGALQELTNKIARYFNLPQLTIPFALSERLWIVKYVIFLGLFAVSLGSANMAATFAEVEPFKTAIALKFVRAWPFVAYALALLLAGLFVQRVFCRYLCPLGAALAIPARNHMFDWLKRRPACGTECHICASRCPVEAIHPDGRINPHECIYCLDCQTIYNDDQRCPPLVERRKRREDRRRAREQARAARTAHQTPTPDNER